MGSTWEMLQNIILIYLFSNYSRCNESKICIKSNCRKLFDLVVALSTAISCASLAVADAGIEMYDVVIGAALVSLR